MVQVARCRTAESRLRTKAGDKGKTADDQQGGEAADRGREGNRSNPCADCLLGVPRPDRRRSCGGRGIERQDVDEAIYHLPWEFYLAEIP